MSSNPPLGLSRTQTIQIEDRLTVPSLADRFAGFADMPPVFATALMAGFVEWVCIEALRPYLTAGEQSVGVHLDLSHAAATPMGMNVTATVELVEIYGGRLRFRTQCRDEIDVICEGTHDRVLIDRQRFDQRNSKKLQKLTA